MDKMEFLRHLSGADFFPLLSNGELKLYILLLVNASAVDTIEKINLKQIEKANGKMPSLSELKAMMVSLERYGLAHLEGVTGWVSGMLRYRLKRPFDHRAVMGRKKKHDKRIRWQKR